MTVRHSGVPCVACFGEETEVRQAVLMHDLLLLFQNGCVHFLPEKGMPEKERKKSDIDGQIKQE
jgi:hypothetical protein